MSDDDSLDNVEETPAFKLLVMLLHESLIMIIYDGQNVIEE